MTVKPKTIKTPLTNIEIDYATRWQDKNFFAEYQRIRRRKKGLKQRPRKCDDGTLFKDRHPELCVREPTYVYSQPWTCQVCNMTMLEGYKERHLNGKLHKQTVEHNDFVEQHPVEEKYFECAPYASCFQDIVSHLTSAESG